MRRRITRIFYTRMSRNFQFFLAEIRKKYSNTYIRNARLGVKKCHFSLRTTFKIIIRTLWLYETSCYDFSYRVTGCTSTYRYFLLIKYPFLSFYDFFSQLFVGLCKYTITFPTLFMSKLGFLFTFHPSLLDTVYAI